MGLTDDLRARALRLLARREYSRQELADKLRVAPTRDRRRSAHQSPADTFSSLPEAPAAPPTTSDIVQLLDDLESRRMLSDDRYAEMRIRLRAPRYSNNRLQQELAQKGIDRDTVHQLLAAQPDETARCQALWQKKFGRAPSDPKDRLRQIRHLANRGFSMRIIQHVICQANTDSPDAPAD